jgi:hypothetical protein
VAASYSKDFDELYTYDGMYQLVDMQRGDLNATKDGLVANSKTFAEDWSLDMTGNWSTYRQDEDGDGNWDLNQLRTHNGANEITQIAGVSTHVAHDRNGNMTKTPKPDDWSNHFDLTYDAWNRLVAVEDGEVLVANSTRRDSASLLAAGNALNNEGKLPWTLSVNLCGAFDTQTT